MEAICIFFTFLLLIDKTTQFFREPLFCNDEGECPVYFACKENTCVCERPHCDGRDVPKLIGARCLSDSDCLSIELMCYGKGELRSCRCRKMYTYDMKFNRCLKDESYFYDPVQNFIIPAIIVMSVGAMIYLGVKLFCNCGKMWRRRQTQLSRELEAMTGAPHQQPTLIASYRVFSQISNSNQHTLHQAPCMGLFVPGVTTNPPPYEEALKHKVILSSVMPSAVPLRDQNPQLPGLPAYVPEPPAPTETRYPPNTRLVASDQNHPLRYYPGEDNPQVPALYCNNQVLEDSQVQSDSDRAAAPAVGRTRDVRGVRTLPRPRRYLRSISHQPP